jgi:Fungal specific transcription factor domain
MASGEDIFSVMQACILLSWYFYQEGRWVEVWIFAGFQTRVAVPLRLNYPGTFSTHGNNSPGAYLAPPKDFLDLESRRRTWWMTIVFDRIASVGGWIHAVDERDLGTELPLRNDDFESEVGH